MTAVLRTHLSREGRDTLWLLAVTLLCIAPHLPRLPLWCSVGTALAIGWRAWLAWRDGPLPPRWVLLIALVAATGLTLATHQSLFGRQAGVTLVTLLTALKTLELRARRDAFVITSLGFFLVLTQFLHSQSIGLAALMLLATVGLLSSLVLAQRPLGRPSIGNAVGTAARSAALGLPLMVALYLLFPRIGPLWSVPADGGPKTGLSDRIELGEMAELALDDSVAMRVRFIGKPPLHHEMYFRGPVLDRFDGRHWTSSAILQARGSGLSPQNSAPAPRALAAAGRQVDYVLTLEPNRLRTVPLLEGTLVARLNQESPARPSLRQDGLSWQASSPLTERTQVTASAWLDTRDTLPPHPQDGAEGFASRPSNLELPVGHNPRTRAWAEAWRAQAALPATDADALAQALTQHIRQGEFRYTLDPEPEPDSGQPTPASHPIDRFWLDTRAGFCEHYATAFVFIMRSLGVPARVVTGFQGAEVNPVDGLHVVRNSDAHAWAEYWTAERGWTRIDPTAAVAPNRIDRPRPPIRYPEQLPPALRAIDPALWSGLRAYADAANHRWNVWVLQYSRQQQMNLLREWGFSSPDWTTLLQVGAGAIGVIALAGLGWLAWQRPARKRSAWHKPLMKLHQGLLAAGWQAPASCPAPAPAAVWAQAIRQQSPGAHAVLQGLGQLDALRYAAGERDQPTHRRALIRDTLQAADRWSREQASGRRRHKLA
jgi:transglutaminase-like putative cysteine protease